MICEMVTRQIVFGVFVDYFYPDPRESFRITLIRMAVPQFVCSNIFQCQFRGTIITMLGEILTEHIILPMDHTTEEERSRHSITILHRPQSRHPWWQDDRISFTHRRWWESDLGAKDDFSMLGSWLRWTKFLVSKQLSPTLPRKKHRSSDLLSAL
jgi:hypothetical protein